MEILQANEEHIPAIQQIYSYHVLYGTATFETEPPDMAEMARRLQKVLTAGLSWFVAVDEGQVRGYCYLSFYRERYAYRFTLEDSVYIDPTFLGRGTGKRLLSSAVMWAEARGFRQLVAVVGNSENAASLALHHAVGFSNIGTLRSAGFKHGRWLDTVIMQRTLGQGDATLPEVQD